MSVQHVDARSIPRPRVAAADDGGWVGGLAQCSCSAVSLSSPAGEVVVLRVSGEVDLLTLSVLEKALTDGLADGGRHLLVDLAELTFCSVGGLVLLVEAGHTAAGRGTGYALSTASRHVDRVLTVLWAAADLPTRYPTAAAGVLAAMARPADRSDTDRSDTDRSDTQAGQAGLPPVVIGVLDDADRLDQDTDRRLVEKAKAGDVAAYRVLVRRHRGRMYLSALRALKDSDDPQDVARDIRSRMRTALAVFAEASPP